MMDLLSGDEPSLTFTYLTQRMGCNVAVSDSFPCTAISLVHIGRPFVFVVVLSSDSFVSWTVLLICQARTTGIGAWSFGLAGHWGTSFRAKKKPRGNTHEAHLAF